ncbi:MAG TPA: hypothetical protein VJ924_07480 [Alphaproteobacteria bacterium]|nr:hypothetical protein [Alphaproteobacteria bacterium]
MEREQLIIGYIIIGLIVGAYSLTDVYARSRSVFEYGLVVVGWPVYLVRQI